MSTPGKEQLNNNSEEVMEQLTSVFEMYNQTTDRMHRSHEQLQLEVIRLRRELEQKNEQLQRKNRLAALGEMAAGIAHEIRNPLGGVQLYASLLQNDLVGQEKPLEWVKKISKGVHALDQIVNDVLVFTQDQPCIKADVNLKGLIVEVLDYVQPQLNLTDIKISYDEIDNDFVVQADVNMLRQVLLNLLMNAIDAVENDGIVTLGATNYTADGYQTKITIKDNGEGLKSSSKDKIFNPFYTTKDTGIGLGLAIVHRLVECHEGAISAVDNESGGATFSLLLP